MKRVQRHSNRERPVQRSAEIPRHRIQTGQFVKAIETLNSESGEASFSKGPYSRLVLGWKLGHDGHPSYWLGRHAKPGYQSENDLVTISADTTAGHTVVVAQSGSGKSSFVGRLVEEIAIGSRSRCVILDTNADFKRIQEVEPASLWSKARYDVQKSAGRLPHETNRTEFETRWKKVRKKILTADRIASRKEPYQRLKIWWPSLSADFITEDLGAAARSQIHLCHEFTRAIARLIRLVRLFEDEDEDSGISQEKVDIANEVETLFGQYNNESVDFQIYLMNHYVTKRFSQAREGSYLHDIFKKTIMPMITLAIKSIKLVDRENQQFYLAKMTQYREILGDEPFTRLGRPKSVTIIDLPSLANRADRLLTVNAILEHETDLAKRAWDRAMRKKISDDRRVPTFIVVDEAHNFAPSVPESKIESALKDQFRTIAAEGRKYGLYLILVTQRPDKLDPYVISECQNKAVMRIGSSFVLATVVRELGLEDIEENLVNQCLHFRKGQLLIAGNWVGDAAQVMYCAPRRTVEGGRNLRPEYWAVGS